MEGIPDAPKLDRSGLLKLVYLKSGNLQAFEVRDVRIRLRKNLGSKRWSFSMRKLMMLLFFALLLLPGSALTAAEKVADLVLVADSRNLNGVTAWWANLFNESHFYFALLTIAIIPLAGVVLGTIADLLMGRLGINLKSRALREG